MFLSELPTNHTPVTGELAVFTVNGAPEMKMFDGTNWVTVGGTVVRERAFEVLAQAEVDGVMWYTVKCSKEVGDWVRTQPEDHWVNHINQGWLFHVNNFDMHRELFAFLKLTWS